MDMYLSRIPFETADAKTWFTIAEKFFKSNKTKESDQLLYLIAALPSKLMKTILEETKFTEAKMKILEKLSGTNEMILEKILEGKFFDPNAKPSDNVKLLAKKLKGVIDDQFLKSTIKLQIMKNLSEDLKEKLVMFTEDSLDDFVRRADALWSHEKTKERTVYSTTSCEVKEKEEEEEINATNVKEEHRICKFHRQFGDRAWYCTKWCVWPDKNNLKIVEQYGDNKSTGNQVNKNQYQTNQNRYQSRNQGNRNRYQSNVGNTARYQQEYQRNQAWQTNQQQGNEQGPSVRRNF